VRAIFSVIAMATMCSASALSQPSGDDGKFNPAILDLRACVRANAPPAYLEGTRTVEDAIAYLRPRCMGSFAIALEQLGAGDAAAGGFRVVVRDEWIAFYSHTRSGR
jgi:hypothetical protein